MDIRTYNIKKSIATFFCLVFSVGAMAQAYSSGGGSATNYKSTIGYNNTATGNYSLAAGCNNIASGQSSIALGFYSKADGLNSVAMGMYTHSQAHHGITIGKGYNGTKPLVNNTDGIMLGAGSNLPTLFISSKNAENRTGMVGIGNVIKPQAKLHIRGDAVEDADIFLVSVGTNKSAIRFRNDDNNIAVGSDNVMRINALNTYLMIDAPKVCFGSTTTFLKNTNNEVFFIKAPKTIAQEAETIMLTAMNTVQMTSKKEILMNSENIFLAGQVGINTENTTTGYALAVNGGIITTKVFIQDVEDWPDHVFDGTYKLMPLNELKKYIGDNKHLPEIPSESEVVGQGYDLHEIQYAMLKKIEELTLYTLQQQEEIETLRKMVYEIKGKGVGHE